MLEKCQGHAIGKYKGLYGDMLGTCWVHVKDILQTSQGLVRDMLGIGQGHFRDPLDNCKMYLPFAPVVRLAIFLVLTLPFKLKIYMGGSMGGSMGTT